VLGGRPNDPGGVAVERAMVAGQEALDIGTDAAQDEVAAVPRMADGVIWPTQNGLPECVESGRETFAGPGLARSAFKDGVSDQHMPFSDDPVANLVVCVSRRVLCHNPVPAQGETLVIAEPDIGSSFTQRRVSTRVGYHRNAEKSAQLLQGADMVGMAVGDGDGFRLGSGQQIDQG